MAGPSWASSTGPATVPLTTIFALLRKADSALLTGGSQVSDEPVDKSVDVSVDSSTETGARSAATCRSLSSTWVG